MPANRKIPRVRLHSSGQWCIKCSGVTTYLGRDETRARQRADTIVSAWLGRGRKPEPPPEAKREILVSELILRFLEVEGPKVSAGEREYLGRLARWLEPFAALPARDFGPLDLKKVQAAMIEKGMSRNYTIGIASRAKTLLKWAVSEALIPPGVYEAVRAVRAPRPGEAAPGRPRRDLTWPEIEAVLPHLPPALRALVVIQGRSGARVGELCSMRRQDIDMGGKVWIFHPPRHKRAHAGQIREIALGPKSQAALRPWLPLAADGLVFSPAKSEEARRQELRAARQSKVQPSQVSRAKENPKRSPGEAYTARTVGYALIRACRKAGIPGFATHDLRRLAAATIKHEMGLDYARAALGHRAALLTEHYASVDRLRAEEAAARLG